MITEQTLTFATAVTGSVLASPSQGRGHRTRRTTPKIATGLDEDARVLIALGGDKTPPPLTLPSFIITPELMQGIRTEHY